MKTLTALAAALHAAAAVAHDGHGLDGSHWHATDGVGFAIGAALAIALWWSGRK